MSKEVYLVVLNYIEPTEFDMTGDEEEYDELTFSSDQSEVYVYNTLEEVNEHVVTESFGEPSLDGDYIKVFHGVIVPASYIPETFNGCTPFLYVKHPLRYTEDLHKHEAYFRKISEGTDVLVKVIEELMTYHVYDSLKGRSYKLIIKDANIFLGYELQMALHCPEQSSDEEAIYRIKKLRDKILSNNNQEK
jgi:hypothetical protein